MKVKSINSNFLNEVCISYKRKALKGYEDYFVTSSKCASTIFFDLWSDKIDFVEESYIILLSRSSGIIGFSQLSSGGTSSTIIDIKIIAQLAIKSNASGIILAHNHPSGNLKPSSYDIDLTKKVKEALKLFDISILDHLILSSNGYFSFADDGLI